MTAARSLFRVEAINFYRFPRIVCIEVAADLIGEHLNEFFPEAIFGTFLVCQIKGDAILGRIYHFKWLGGKDRVIFRYIKDRDFRRGIS